MRKVKKTDIYDRLHRGSVWTLLALTAFGSTMLVFRTYKYFTVTRPRQYEKRQMLAEEQLAQEQLEREADLVRRQREAETLKS